MRILLTNDDGIFAPGLLALRRHAAKLGEVHVVAPAEQQSGSSHSFSFHQPIQVKEARRDGEFVGHMIRGTPVDCVKIALAELLDQKPDVIISGINDKANFGISVLYSGTVGAAIEAALAGIHAIAISVDDEGSPCSSSRRSDRGGLLQGGPDLDYAAELACDLAREAAAHPRPKPVLLNVNVPALPRDRIKGVKWIRHNVAPYTERFRHTGVHDGWDHYHIYGVTGPREQSPGDDVAAFLDGYATITPLRIDFTDHDELAGRSGR